MCSQQIQYAEIIIPLPLVGTYTYSIPDELQEKIRTGQRVTVQFGAKKIYSGIVFGLHSNKPQAYKTKPILNVLDDKPVVSEIQLKLWKWISDYYLCTPGEVLKAALPSGLRLESETRVIFNPDFDYDEDLTPREKEIFTLIKNKKILTISELQICSTRKNVFNICKLLLQKEAVHIEERIKESYKPKFETYLKLASSLNEEANLHKILDSLKNAPRQRELLINFLERAGENPIEFEISKNELTGQNPSYAGAFTALAKKGILTINKKQVERINHSTTVNTKNFTLSEKQEQAYKSINQQFSEKDVVLLHGVTSSGKTQIYIQLIKEYLEAGRQVLYLLPEIALTTQIINRLKVVFGDKAGVYHSKFNDAERIEIWNGIAGNNPSLTHYSLVLGVRSSVFLPFENLGLIIIDEEHENTFKQHDPAPRYHARDTAIMLARLHGAKTLLGTATPAIETYFNARAGKYGLVELFERYQNIKLPEIKVIDIKRSRKKKQMHSHFTHDLLEHIDLALNNDKQVILFQNRRGFALLLECTNCGYIPKCEYCDVSLTYHKNKDAMICHYCGYTVKVPSECPDCGQTTIKTIGFGTEKIEDELHVFLPRARIKRMDFDTTRSKNGYETILRDFENKKIDILVGTQMISKGLDFEDVGLVGILNADSMLNFPDFRAYERSYQLMAQVSGRAGRKDRQGIVLIQTSSPENTIIRDVVNNDYFNMYYKQLIERKEFNYPPFFRLIRITIKHKDFKVLSEAAEELALHIKKIFGNRLLGPEYPPVSRIQSLYLKNMLLKIEKEKSVGKAKKLLLQIIHTFTSKNQHTGIQIICNVDPL